VRDGDQMVMNEKNHQKKSNERYKKVLNKNDPFDQLIMELAQKGILDVCAVEIGQESSIPETHKYSRKLVPYRGKYTS
jgi:hypothetical protein